MINSINYIKMLIIGNNETINISIVLLFLFYNKCNILSLNKELKDIKFIYIQEYIKYIMYSIFNTKSIISDDLYKLKYILYKFGCISENEYIYFILDNLEIPYSIYSFDNLEFKTIMKKQNLIFKIEDNKMYDIPKYIKNEKYTWKLKSIIINNEKLILFNKNILLFENSKLTNITNVNSYINSSLPKVLLYILKK